jgi:SAM-dependent methyltransferase
MPEQRPPYSVLAAGYDIVMEHVEYDVWAAYIHDLFQQHLPEARTVLELGSGTGSLAFELQPLGDYSYHGIDAAEPMVRIAREKAEMLGSPATFEVADFTDYRAEPPVDIALLLYDGLNYLLETDAIRDLLRCTAAAVRPGGLFVFDLSTPANSINNAEYFEDEGGEDEFAYLRRSEYDPAARLHRTRFQIEVDGRKYEEVHVQRAYEMNDIRPLLAETPFEEVAALDNLTSNAADETSERIHWIVRRRAE